MAERVKDRWTSLICILASVSGNAWLLLFVYTMFPFYWFPLTYSNIQQVELVTVHGVKHSQELWWWLFIALVSVRGAPVLKSRLEPNVVHHLHGGKPATGLGAQLGAAPCDAVPGSGACLHHWHRHSGRCRHVLSRLLHPRLSLRLRQERLLRHFQTKGESQERLLLSDPRWEPRTSTAVRQGESQERLLLSNKVRAKNVYCCQTQGESQERLLLSDSRWEPRTSTAVRPKVRAKNVYCCQTQGESQERLLLSDPRWEPRTSTGVRPKVTAKNVYWCQTQGESQERLLLSDPRWEPRTSTAVRPKVTAKNVYCCQTQGENKEHLLDIIRTSTAVRPKVRAKNIYCCQTQGESQERLLLSDPRWEPRTSTAVRPKVRTKNTYATLSDPRWEPRTFTAITSKGRAQTIHRDIQKQAEKQEVRIVT